jgi:hypothetical protein
MLLVLNAKEEAMVLIRISALVDGRLNVAAIWDVLLGY